MGIRVITEHPIAVDSPDHIRAEHSGTANDNSYNPHFNTRLYNYFQVKPSVDGFNPSVDDFRLMDLGCAGGKFVKTILDDGFFAVGIDGSDYCKQRGKFEWSTIPENLFTTDITKPFSVVENFVHGPEDQPILFDCITAWEVMEHIKECDLPQLIKNVLNHLKENGVWVMSVSEQWDGFYHQTVKDKNWWLNLFAKFGLEFRQEVYDALHPHWVRGPEKTAWAFDAAQSFHLCLKRRTDENGRTFFSN